MELNGSSSYDPDGDDKIVSYSWSQISGTSCNIDPSTAQRPIISNLTAGHYTFELKVTDKEGLSSKNTVMVDVSGSPAPQEINLDVSLTNNYSFRDNDIYCYDNFWFEQCEYYDVTTIEGSFNYPQAGQMILSAHEEADTAVSDTNHNTYIGISINVAPSRSAGGSCSVNFKKLIQQGGGAFSGTWKLEE